MPTIADTFSPDIYTNQALTVAVNQMPRTPGMIGQSGYFEEVGIAELDVVVEEMKNSIGLLPASLRGGPGQPLGDDKRAARKLSTIHIQGDASIKADDLRGVRAFGSVNNETLANVVNRKMGKARRFAEVTIEHHRATALQGKILDSDGSTLVNLFTEFGVTEQTQDFAFSTATTDIRALCIAVARKIEDAIGAAMYEDIHCLCSSTWFDELIDHDEVKSTLVTTESRVEDTRNDPRRGFRYGGILFKEYRYTVSSQAFITADTARAFPVGVPEGYVTVMSPDDTLASLGQEGVPFSARMYENPNGKSMQIEVQANQIQIPTYPAALIKLTKS